MFELNKNTPPTIVSGTTGEIEVSPSGATSTVSLPDTITGDRTLSGRLTLTGQPDVDSLSSSDALNLELKDHDDIDPRMIIFRDDFISGGRTNGIIGETGWGLSGTGATCVERSSSGVSPNHTSFRITTGSTAGQFARMYTANGLSGAPTNFATLTGWRACCIVSIPDITSVTFAAGFSANPNASDFTDRLVGFRFKAGTDTNWQGICKNDISTFALSASSSLADLGVAAANNVFVKLEMQCLVAGTIQFRINGGAWSNITSNLPSITSLFYIFVEPTTNSARSFDVDFVAWRLATSR